MKEREQERLRKLWKLLTKSVLRTGRWSSGRAERGLDHSGEGRKRTQEGTRESKGKKSRRAESQKKADKQKDRKKGSAQKAM